MSHIKVNQIDHDTVRVECFDDFCRLSCKHRLFGFQPGSHDFKSVILQCRNRKVHPFRVQVNTLLQSDKRHSQSVLILCFIVIKIQASCAPGMKTAFGTEDVPAEVALKQGRFQIFLLEKDNFLSFFEDFWKLF